MKLFISLIGLVWITSLWAEEPLAVFVSIEPQRYLVERIGGERVKVETMVPPGKSPHAYEPSPSQMTLLARAKSWFVIGIDFERAILPRVKKSYPRLRIDDISKNIVRRKFTRAEVGDHHHGEKDNGHHHEDRAGADDPHVWMSLRLAQIQASNIFQTLIEMDPANRSGYEKNYQLLRDELRSLDQKLQQALAPYKGKVFFVYHPAFGYFADDYGLRQVAVEVGGKEPSPAVLNAVIKKAKKENVKVVFVQAGFSRKSAEAVAQAISGKVVEINQLLSNYPLMFQQLLDALIEAWQ